jgi:NTE family protein
MRQSLSLLQILAILLIVTGCASSARYPDNPPLGAASQEVSHGIQDKDPGELLLALTFSGGGSRAAALAYGILEELRHTRIPTATGAKSLLEEADMISAVSGGSITAAYYGLHGKRLFSDFRGAFLERDTSSELQRLMISPANLARLSSPAFGTGDLLDEYFRQTLFGDSTLTALVDSEGPFIQINATDLFKGGRFGFTPEMFSLICSDINEFPIARAVAASSAVPLIFTPVTLNNHAGSCDQRTPDWLAQGLDEAGRNNRRYRLARQFNTYLEQERHPHIHLLDGGLADNLGVRAIIDRILIDGGLWNTLKRFNQEDVRQIAMVVVDASALPPSQWEQSSDTPPTAAILDAATTTPLANYNFETLEYLRTNLDGWRRQLKEGACPTGADCVPPEIFLVEIRLEDIADPAIRERLTSVPTDFRLPPEVIDDLIRSGRELLRNHPEFVRLRMNAGMRSLDQRP